ncbi:MAG: carboxypeptidase-like regulatory domain-containing protein [Gemmatimonadetes bacterium]|nr:carboxypeptidase-like regulatory domain-containing protein [Gemmatimonadota bacterium]
MNGTPGAVLLPLLALAAACQEGPVQCAMPMDVFAPPVALQVAVVDSATGQSLLPGARGRWIVGAETDSLRHWGSTLAALGPAGRYTVAVEAPGYRAWARSDIRVRAGECGPEMREVTARMQRE